MLHEWLSLAQFPHAGSWARLIGPQVDGGGWSEALLGEMPSTGPAVLITIRMIWTGGITP